MSERYVVENGCQIVRDKKVMAVSQLLVGWSVTVLMSVVDSLQGSLERISIGGSRSCFSSITLVKDWGFFAIEGHY